MPPDYPLPSEIALSTPVAPAHTFIKYPSIDRAPEEVQEAIKYWCDEGRGPDLIKRFLRQRFNYNPGVTVIRTYKQKYMASRGPTPIKRVLPTLSPPQVVTSVAVISASNKVLADVRSEISSVNELLAKVPNTSEKAMVLKSLICKCIDRVSVIEKQPLTAQLEGTLVRYLGEIRENVALFVKLSDQELSEDKVAEAVQAEFHVILEAVKDVIVEVCPQYLPAIKDRLKLKLQTFDGSKEKSS